MVAVAPLSLPIAVVSDNLSNSFLSRHNLICIIHCQMTISTKCHSMDNDISTNRNVCRHLYAYLPELACAAHGAAASPQVEGGMMVEAVLGQHIQHIEISKMSGGALS